MLGKKFKGNKFMIVI